jgi:hypothetical protein
MSISLIRLQLLLQQSSDAGLQNKAEVTAGAHMLKETSSTAQPRSTAHRNDFMHP